MGKIQSVPKYRQLPKVDTAVYFGPSTQDSEIALRTLPAHLRAVLNGMQALDILKVAWPGIMKQDGMNVRPSKSAVTERFKEVLREYNGIDLGAALTDLWSRSAAFESAVETQIYLADLARNKLSELLWEKGRIEESLAAKEQVTDIDRISLRHKRCLALEADLRAKLAEIQAKIDGMRAPARSENLAAALTINF